MNPVKEVDCLPVAMKTLDPEETLWASRAGTDGRPHKVSRAAREAVKELVSRGWRFACDRESTAVLFLSDPVEVSIKRSLQEASKQGIVGVFVIDESARIVARYPVSLLEEL